MNVTKSLQNMKKNVKKHRKLKKKIAEGKIIIKLKDKPDSFYE